MRVGHCSQVTQCDLCALTQMADRFVDMVMLGDQDAVAAIRREDIDILLDMQVFDFAAHSSLDSLIFALNCISKLHTMGHRIALTASQPSPIQAVLVRTALTWA